MNRSFHRWLTPAFILALSFYVSSVVADRAYFTGFERKGVPYGLYAVDARRGHALTPSFTGLITTSRSFPVTINPQGYRGEPWTYEAPRRFLIAGDSFTFGEPLALEDGFIYKLSRQFPTSTRFYNAGVSSYGTVHVLETLIKECPIVQPTHIVYMYYLNDTRWDNIQADATTVLDGYLVYRYADNGRRRLTDAQIRQKIREALAKNHPPMSAYLRLEHLREGLRTLWAPQGASQPMETTDVEAYPLRTTDIGAGHIRRMYDIARAAHAQFTMVILPSYAEAHFGFKEPATERLLAKLGRTPFPILDLRDTADARVIHRLSNDAHYDKDTTTWIARQLALYIRNTYNKNPA